MAQKVPETPFFFSTWKIPQKFQKSWGGVSDLVWKTKQIKAVFFGAFPNCEALQWLIAAKYRHSRQ